ncbi:hypothetical protein BJV78DRAFT_1157290 [Lactifluus subvellereus]|nr:hypothetical protein BJV78DRAFT_1157290 [Lactifluus subvellereus]
MTCGMGFKQVGLWCSGFSNLRTGTRAIQIIFHLDLGEAYSASGPARSRATFKLIAYDQYGVESGARLALRMMVRITKPTLLIQVRTLWSAVLLLKSEQITVNARARGEGDRRNWSKPDDEDDVGICDDSNETVVIKFPGKKTGCNTVQKQRDRPGSIESYCGNHDRRVKTCIRFGHRSVNSGETRPPLVLLARTTYAFVEPAQGTDAAAGA